MTTGRQLSNPFSTGGGGVIFETQVQTAFTFLMLTGSLVPCLPPWPITKIKLQGKRAGYDTDDVIVFVADPSGKREAKLLAQIKHSVAITKRAPVFTEVIQAAWSDFNNTELFQQTTDSISLITGPLSAADTEARQILEWARHAENAKDFLEKVNRTKFSSRTKQTKLAVFRECLKRANGGSPLSDDSLWGFLKHFHLLEVDLDIEYGLSRALVSSLIRQYAAGEETAIWSMGVNLVQTVNQNEGTITWDSIPEDLALKFRGDATPGMPAGSAEKHNRQAAIDWSQKSFAADLGVAFLMGGWEDSVKGDLAVGAKLSKKDVDQWIAAVHGTLQDPETPLVLRNGTWSSDNRRAVWETVGKGIFDSGLDSFRPVAVQVLSERDPVFELPAEERYMANVKGKVLTHSQTLRRGIADTLAVMGGWSKVFSNCSRGKAETVALLVVREVLSNADWVLWGSLNNLLPLLAEAAPDEFLSAVETAIGRDPCPFNRLFAEEGKGMMGNNYLTGLLWALETLAWDEQYLTRAAIILAELSEIDPGGNWTNRPTNSLTTIFLPWFPQTTASVAKRQAAMRTVVKESPTSGWAILLSLLPSQHQTSCGSHKPRWRQTVPKDSGKGVPRQEYLDQVSSYAEMALEMAEGDTVKLQKLVETLDTLPPQAFERLLTHLGSATITGLPEEARTSLWSAMVKFTARHRRYADAKWALEKDVVERIDSVTSQLAPKSPSNLYQRLFGGSDSDLYEKNGKWEEQAKKLTEQRQRAIGEVYSAGGVEEVIHFANIVGSPTHVGGAFAAVAGKKEDAAILPALLSDDRAAVQKFTASYIWARQRKEGWGWVDQTVSTDWGSKRLGTFLRSLPFCHETWVRVSTLLRDNDSTYWAEVLFNPFEAENDYAAAVDKLLEHGRPNAAIACLDVARYKGQCIDRARTTKALLAAATTRDATGSMDFHHTMELIKALQEDPQTDADELFKIEWAYLPVLDGYHGATPKLLENRLASTPQFFCEVIRTVFRSKHEKDRKRDPTEREQNLATNAYRLLHRWKTPPGTLLDGSFSPSAFQQWVTEVKSTCKKTGHIEVAMSQVGQVLIHVPRDPSGLWIDATVADALNSKDAEDMRRGFETGLFNSRGVHSVDPTGAPEKDLAAKYKTQADDAEQAGYYRLAGTMRNLSNSYIREAERIITEHQTERQD